MILILDDHPLVRQGLSSVIHMFEPGKKIIEAATVDEAKKMVEEESISMAFVDLRLTNESGFQFVSWLKETGSGIKTFVITSSKRKQDFTQAHELGVDAYVLKDAFVEEIMYAFKTVERGNKFYSASIVDRIQETLEFDRKIQSLTTREAEVLLLLLEGMSNSKISQSLFISEGTTKKHISNLFEKLGLKNRVEAVLFAGKHEDEIREMLGKSAN